MTAPLGTRLATLAKALPDEATGQLLAIYAAEARELQSALDRALSRLEMIAAIAGTTAPTPPAGTVAMNAPIVVADGLLDCEPVSIMFPVVPAA